jgi:formate hydrogenlyase subunit 3/multisubunit Na+/H+ antiporter MnhD subunit
MNPFLPILLVLTGAGAMLIGLALPRSRAGVVGLVPVIATLLALMADLAIGFRLPSELTVSAWPDAMFGTGLTLQADRTSWLFSLGILVAALAAFLTGLSRPGGPRLGERTASLLVVAAALAAVQSKNLITLGVTWAVLDGLYFVSLLLLAQGQKIQDRATLSLTFNIAATFCVLGAAIDSLSNGVGTFQLGVSALSERGALLLLLAVLFRLGVFPFHLDFGDATIRKGLGTLLRLAPAAVAFSLLTHVVSVAPQLPDQSWLSLAAVLGLLIGAVQWWESSDPRQGLSYMTLAQSSLAFLAALWGGEQAGLGVLAIGLATILGGAVMFLNNGFNPEDRLWAIPVALGAYVLVGGPLMVGFIGAAVIYGGLITSGGWIVFIACVLGQILLAASYLRLVFAPAEETVKGEPIIGVAYLFGLIFPLAFALVGGLAVGSLAESVGEPALDLFAPQSLTALGAVVVSIIGGVGLWRFESMIRAQAGNAWSVASAVARLDWLYTLAWDIYRFFGRILRIAAAVLEGEGGVLWTIVAALLVWLLFRGN